MIFLWVGGFGFYNYCLTLKHLHKSNGMKGIGVLYGYGSRDELIEAGAQHVCATPDAILDCIS